MTARVTYPNVLTPIQTVQQRRVGCATSLCMTWLGVSNPEMLLEERESLSVAPRVRPVEKVFFQIPAGVEKIVDRFQVRIRPSSGFNREDGILRAADDEERDEAQSKRQSLASRPIPACAGRNCIGSGV